MKKELRTAINLIKELAAPAILIITLVLAAVLILIPHLQQQLQPMLLIAQTGEHWNVIGRGEKILWHAIPPALTICGIGLLFGISIGIAKYEAIIGGDTRRQLAQAEQRYLNAESLGLVRAKQQLHREFARISSREQICERQALEATRRAESEEQRAELAEWQLARAKEELARLEARKSSAQGAAERHKRRNRHKPQTDNDDDYSRNPSPTR